MKEKVSVESEVYKFLDMFGVPYQDIVRFGLRVDKNENDSFQRLMLENDADIEKIYYKDDIIISKLKGALLVQPALPKHFKLNLRRQIELVQQWFYDTTGFKITDIGVLKEIPYLNNNPFVLQVTRGYNEKWFVLAGNEIKGDLTLTKKFNSYGYLGQNWIKSFGNTKCIIGNLYVDIELRDFGLVEKIAGNLSFSNHVYQNTLDSLSPIIRIDGDLNLKNTHLGLGSLEYVGGNLNLRKTTVHNLGNLKLVKGNVLMSKNQSDKVDLTGVEILGKVKYYNDVFNERSLTLPTY